MFLMMYTTSQAKDNKPTGNDSTLSKCIAKKISKCKRDPLKNPKFCNSASAKRVYRVLCNMFPKGNRVGVRRNHSANKASTQSVKK